MRECDCNLCKEERKWAAKSDLCYRCAHELPCQIAEENEEPCCSVLDVMSRL